MTIQLRPGSPAAVKAACNRHHARVLMFERYGIDPAPSQVATWEAGIRDGLPEYLTLAPNRGSPNRSLCVFRHGGEWIPVVFDHATGTICTVLPPHAIDKWRRTLDPVKPAPKPEPFVGKVVGFVPTPARPEFPPLPEVPDDATIADYDAAIATLAGDSDDLNAMLQGGGHPRRKEILEQVARISAARKDLRARRHRLYSRQHASAAVDDPTDPVKVVAGLLTAIHSMGDRLGPENVTEAEFRVREAGRYYLALNDSGPKKWICGLKD